MATSSSNPDAQAVADVSFSLPTPASPPPPSPSVPSAVSPEVRADIALGVERLQFATLLGERKKAVAALQSLAQKFDASRSPGGRKSNSSSVDPRVEEQELGDATVPAVLAALVSDPRDTELMEAMLEFLQSVVSRAPSAALLLLEQPSTTATATARAAGRAAGAFAKSVLECKEGLRCLLEVVEYRREHIRDAALAVLGQLTGRDKNAQQFLAFEEGFARLFQIMEVEGLAETGASPASSVIADCLQIVNNMVRDNLMTQTLFLEMTYLESHVPRLLRLPGIDGGEEEEDAAALSRRKRVLKLGLQLVRFLVAGLYEGARESSLDEMAQRDRDRKGQELARIQSLVARQEALMGAVGELVCCRSDALADLRLQALDLLRLVTEHNGSAQMLLVNLYASPSGRNALAELVNLDVGNGSDESPIAAASSALLDTLFEESEGARMAMLQHIQSAPPPPMSSGGDGGYDAFSAPPSAGRVLLDAFICNAEFIIQCDAVRDIVGSVTNLSVLADSLSDEQSIASSRGVSEMTQLRGLIALLQECCLEFLCEDEEEQALKIASAALVPVAVEQDQGLQMTRGQLLQMISKIMAEQIQKRVIAIYTGVDQGSTPSAGVESGTPSAIGAYQDLIRMQDKQIHDLQQEVESLKQRVANGAGDSNAANASMADPGRKNDLMEMLSTQREQFEREKAELESKIKSMSESALEMETRVNGLTMAYEQLERKHQQRGQELAAAHSGVTGVSSPAASSGLEEQIAMLQAELDAERETNRRLRSEATAAKGGVASQALREKGDAELADARLMTQLEELRVENKQKDEQLAECTQMLETLTEGQNLVKRDNEWLKAELTELRSRTDQAGEADGTECMSVVDEGSRVLRQRIQEVEAVRRASPPVSVECAALETALPTDEALKTEADVGGESQEVNEDQRLKELVSTQLEELMELRALVAEMGTVAIERDAQVKQASFLQELKFEATVRELEDELARAFLEKKDAGRKAKAAVKELENEVARLFLAKVELEKELSVHQQGERGSHAENGEMLSANGSFRRSIASETSNDSTFDDLLVLGDPVLCST
ncbi:hypothetical protein PHYSODRAFT_342496 [Phytophthora sojae]|uniref:Vesicle tethering protein Uso1/P115-like head domain-containing protein n=1 Tax=Phytophthora sojae (strain P6497) TaxID=1094619 RepID=G5AGS3_PHYSP|nr:hypothetical protein PHYSODRAFT_342496 [Phytophthora sojae]EGZ05353.1 hypothetical protein PHYSODRAFT_342496 [Phytophthora sojae]|eukprot:XP_009539274.1 hypothetical protein PHYSODRAFT_342496 [Phytophthora sojae]